MNYGKGIKRRTFLRGAGTIMVGLPFLEEMALGAVTDPPTRLMTLFFGLGLHPDWQRDFSGPLGPFQSLRDKMAMFSVSVPQSEDGGAHCNTGVVIFTGERKRNTSIAGGPSIDQIVRSARDPSGPTLASGLWWRRGACDGQALRVFAADGSGRPPIKRPSVVFDRLFGSFTPPPVEPPPPAPTPPPPAPTPTPPPPSPSPTPTPTPPNPGPSAEELQRRFDRSILDTVMDQYKNLTGNASYLGADSKQKMEQHLNTIREVERQIAPSERLLADFTSGNCTVPSRPSDPPVANYDLFTYGLGSGAPGMSWQDFQQVFRLHADLWTLGLRCDRVRFGNLMFESAGGHTNLSGTYSAMGDSTNFPGTSQHDSYFHGNQLTPARLYQHFAMSNLAYFLQSLDDRSHLEANGKTVLDNMTVVIGTEYGWNHSTDNTFHAVAGGGGRFRSGLFTNRRFNCIDIYNAVLQGLGINGNIGQRTGVASMGDAAALLLP